MRQKVREELLTTLVQDLRYGIISCWIAVLLLYIGLFPVLPGWKTGGWALILSLLLGVGWRLTHRLRSGSGCSFDERLGMLRRFILLFTLLWSIGIFWLFVPDHPLHQSYLIIVIAGITAGSLYTLAADILSARIVITALLGTLSLRLLGETEVIYRLESLLVLVYMGLLLYLAGRFHRQRFALLEGWYRAGENASRLAKSRARLAFIFDAVPAGIFYYDRNLNIVEGNALFYRFFGENGRIRIPEAAADLLHKALERPGKEYERDLPVGTRKTKRWIRLKAKSVFSESRHEGVGVLTDITEQKKRMERIRFEAEHDPLTRLPNRNLFLKRLGEYLRKLDPHRESAGILFIDLDRFKPINDLYGHRLGDRVLQAVGDRLRHHLRHSDLLARYGGDEFVVLITPLPPAAREAEHLIAAVAKGLLEHFRSPITLDGKQFHIGLSIGIATTFDESSDPQTLLSRADEAMYRAKKDGKNRFRFFRSLRPLPD